MVESGRCFRLARESVDCRRRGSDVLRRELQGDDALELRVLGLLDDAHATLAELLEDAVVRDGGADHCQPAPFDPLRDSV